jgi:hypothetical protein
MTELEKLWHAFERANLPAAKVPSNALFAMTHAYHRGAYDMLVAVNAMKAATPQEATAYLHELELYCRSVIERKRDKLQ